MAQEKKFRIIGGNKLIGNISIFGAKNAINKQLVASILTDEPSIFYNVPKISEIETVLSMLADIGSVYEWINETTVKIQTSKISNDTLNIKYSGVNRIPILFLGALLHRINRANVPIVGGCNIGPRPVDFHIQGLQKMGVNITEEGELIKATVDKMIGCDVNLPFPSIGATENLLLAGCLAEGTTVINNAAIEPEVIDTILVLQKMGAQISVEADRRIIIDGVSKLKGVEHKVIPDRMEAAAIALAAIATDGRVKILDAKQEHLITLLNTVRKMGADFIVDADGITFFRANKNLEAIHLETDVHPGFMTDWQQPLVVALTQAEGASVIHETLYENRFGYTQTLNEMGANISLSNRCLGSKECRYKNKNYMHSAVIIGKTKLKGQNITIPDLRAGFAYIIAALVAEGQSDVSGLYQIERGHPNLAARLKNIGANIEVIYE